MIDPQHLLLNIIRPVLSDLSLPKQASREKLILGTACQESACGRWLVQLNIPVGNGGLGIYQMEEATHKDLYDNFLKYKEDLKNKVVLRSISKGQSAREMIGNLYYATAMCAIHYYRTPEAIPDTLPEQAAFYKKYYNTELGKATVGEYIVNWRTYIPATFNFGE